jgi:CMP-N-acetylneuraminic acid synthetase
MYKDKHLLCVIPARGGSKRLPGKNIKELAGKPLIAYAIVAAKGSQYIDRVVVSTDSEEIAEVARTYGAEVPFMRPTELASDTAKSVAVLKHALTECEKEDDPYDAIVLVQPTTPGVLVSDIDAAIKKLLESSANSCVSVCEITERPEYMYMLDDTGKRKAFIGGPEQRSQDMPKLYRLNGAVYALLRSTLVDQNKVYDDENGVAVIMPHERSIDIDTALDFLIAEVMLQGHSQAE